MVRGSVGDDDTVDVPVKVEGVLVTGVVHIRGAVIVVTDRPCGGGHDDEFLGLGVVFVPAASWTIPQGFIVVPSGAVTVC